MSRRSEAMSGASSLARPVAPGREARLFWKLRVRIAATTVTQMLRSARLKFTVLTVFSAVFWIGLFLLFLEGFRFLNSGLMHEATRAQTVQAIYNIFFLALTCMIGVSSAIILYGSLYRSEEVDFLLTTPASAAAVARHKLQEAVLFSCWGFILLGSPMLIAYGVVNESPWWYYALLPLFMMSFVLIPTGIGATACMLLVQFFPQLRRHAMAIICVFAVAMGAAVARSVFGGESHNLMTPDWFDEVIGRLRFAQQRLFPNWWLSSGLLEAAHPAADSGGRPSWMESLLFLAVLASNALLLQRLAMWTGQRYFRSGYSGLADTGRSKKKTQAALIDRLVMKLAWVLSPSMRTLIVKDLRLFRRDPVQWSQFAIFFGLLSLYFLNIRRFQYSEPLSGWLTVIGFMNLGVVGLILSTYTTRFILPAISLEGRRFWILGTLPISRDSILWSKLCFSCAASIPVCCALILLSDVMLGIASKSPMIAVIHQATCLILCVGLSSLAVGIGARLPVLRETSPSKIAAGFGGTLNLVVSTIFIILVVLCTGAPCYRWMLGPSSEPNSWLAANFGWGAPGAALLGALAALLLGAAATVLPLRIGFRAFRQLEI